MTFDELEARVSQRLAGLPVPSAPGSLLPRVLAGVRLAQDARGASRRRGVVRWLGGSAGIAAVAAAALLATASPVADVARVVDTLARAVVLLWRAVAEPNIVPLAALVGFMGALSALSCAALSRMLSERGAE